VTEEGEMTISGGIVIERTGTTRRGQTDEA
jgi:hypothetical protein